MLRDDKHLFTGSIQRYVLKDKVDEMLVSIWLVWKDSELPDEAVHLAELEAFKQEFSDVLDWETAVIREKEGMVYT